MTPINAHAENLLTSRNGLKSHRGNDFYLWEKDFMLYHPEKVNRLQALCPLLVGDCYQTQLNAVLGHNEAVF